MRTTTIIHLTIASALVALPLSAETKSSSLLMGKTFSSVSEKGEQPAVEVANTKGDLITPAEPFGEEASVEDLVEKALESPQATAVYNEQVNSVFDTINSGGTVTIEEYKASFLSALNSFFGF